MVYSFSKDGIKRLLIYQQTVLLVDKEDILTFEIDNEYLKFTLNFSYSADGDPFSTTYWENQEANLLHFRLNNWDHNTWVEISKPVLLKVKDSNTKFWMRFRNNSQPTKNLRKFEVSVWKEVSNE